MLIPRHMPVDLAWLNAHYGAPIFGPFSPCPPPPDELASWALTIPWAMNMLGSVMGKVVLVLPPTLPGVAWMIRDGLSVVDIARTIEPPGLPMLSALLFGGVQWAGPIEHLDRATLYGVGIRLSPLSAPPSVQELSEIAMLFRPGALLVLAFRVAHDTPLQLPVEWRPVRGDSSVLPGLPAFDAVRFSSAFPAAWVGPAGAVGLLGCERTA